MKCAPLIAIAAVTLGLSSAAHAASCPTGFTKTVSGGQTLCIQATGSGGLSQNNSGVQTQIAVLEDKLNNANDNIHLLFIVLGVVGGVGALGSFITWFLPYRREGSAQRQILTSEQSAQQRADAAERRAETVHEAFLQGSRETLELVNATLRLAKDASERAADEVIRKARIASEDLDQRARGLLAEVEGRDDRSLIADPDRRSRLRSLAHRIAGFEVSEFLLPVDVGLRPHSIFVRGMESHLAQQFSDAVSYWEKVALDTSAPDNLKSLAWYWIGYENNNLGNFERAYQDFDNALRLAEGPRKFELQRILIETHFFDKHAHRADELIVPMRQLFDSMSLSDADVQLHRVHIAVTLGNIYYASAREIPDAVNRPQWLTDAELMLSEFSAKDKWARFALAQVQFERAKSQEAEELFRKCRADALDEYATREEPRTKILARTTELICCIRVPEWRNEAQVIYSDVLDRLGSLDGRLTIYSQLQKRNVRQSEFRKDLTELIDEEGVPDERKGPVSDDETVSVLSTVRTPPN
jgi:tetratricopeptide (TPR) repeat protein